MKLTDLSIKSKLVLITTLSSTLTFIVLSLAVLIYEDSIRKFESVNHLSSLATIIGTNSTAALLFQDKGAAKNTLAAIKTELEIVVGCIYDSKNKLFSVFIRPDQLRTCPEYPQESGHYFSQSMLFISQPIILDNEQVGTIELVSDLSGLYRRRVFNLILILILIFVAILVSYLLSIRFQSIISKPILHLTETAKLIAKQQNVSVRAIKTSGDETSVLVDAFNYMLTQLQDKSTTLRNQSRIQSLILENIADGIIVAKDNDEFILWNPAAYRLMGRDQRQIPSRDWPRQYHLYHIDQKTPYTSDEIPLRKAIRGENVNQEEIYMKNPNNPSDSWLSITAAPMKDENGFVQGGVAVIRDITETKRNLERLRKIQESLQDAVRTREEFLSIAAHELRTPLTPLRLQIQLLMEIFHPTSPRAFPEKAIYQIVLSTDKQLDRMSKLIDNLLDVSRISSGRLNLSMELSSLSALTKEVIDRYSTDLEALNYKISSKIQDSIMIKIDRIRIEQVITNILTNAIKYGEGKPIHVELTTDKDCATLVVQDQGIGIAHDDLKRVFERFQRAVPSTSFGGLGLGLYITSQIVDAHGGSISVESKLNQGSTFIVKLPFVQPAP